MSRIKTAVDHIAFARGYTENLLEAIPASDWFRQPTEGVTHIAWQVGHLAMAEYRLALERLRPRGPADEALISDNFLALFARDSVPDADPGKYPPVEEIQSVFRNVHEQVMRELSDFPEADLDSPVLKPHVFVKTKGWALTWCSHHEMIHAGQIGLLRRLLGAAPKW